MDKENNLQWKMTTKVGTIFLVASSRGLKSILWHEQKEISYLHSLKEKSITSKIINQAVTELNEYFAGKRSSFDIPMVIAGTQFQVKVWKELLKIPYGKKVSYKDIADRIKSKAVRAVGSANGRNSLSIIIPCHRVIAHNGSLGGYSGGLKIKQQLLAIENPILDKLQ